MTIPEVSMTLDWQDRALMRRFEKHEQVCEWSGELKTIIHRFNLGSRICVCRKCNCTQDPTTGGWRNKKHDSPE